MMNEIKFKWHMLAICDPLFLPGESIYAITNILLKILNVQYVVLSDLQGAGAANLIINEKIPVLKIDEFLKRILSVDQFDWGDFFLFSTFPNTWQTFEKKTYPEIISLTETTIRAVDDSYIYVYTPYNNIVQLIKENYIIEEIKSGHLSELDYPY